MREGNILKAENGKVAGCQRWWGVPRVRKVRQGTTVTGKPLTTRPTRIIALSH